MTAFVGCEAIVFLTVLCLVSLLYAQDPSTQNTDYSTTTAERADDSTEVTSGKPRSRYDAGVSARTETTPAVCPRSVNCEFHHYERFNPSNIIGVTRYCICAEDQQCTYSEINMIQSVYVYKCVNITKTTTEPISTVHGETEQGSSTPTETNRTPEDGYPSRSGSENSSSLRKLDNRVGDVMEHAEL